MTYFPAKKLANRKYENTNVLKQKEFYLITIVFSLTVGLRWDVGTDYLHYYDIYTSSSTLYGSVERLEFFPRIFMLLGNIYNLPYYCWFVAMAFVQIFFVTYGTSLVYKKALPLVLLFYYTFFLCHDFNIVRQAAAYSIAYFAFCQSIRGKYIYAIFWVVVSFFFHRASVIVIPLFLLFFVHKVPNKYLQLVIYLTTSIGGTILLKYLIVRYGVYMQFLGGDIYIDRILYENNANKLGSGLGALFQQAICVLIILMSDKILNRNQKLTPLYLIFIIGASLYRPCMEDQYLLRLIQHLSFFVVLFAGITMFEIKKEKYNQIGTIATIATIGMFLLSSLSIEWMFIWDK